MVERFTFLYMRPLVVLLLLTACENPFVPQGASPFNPPAAYADLWQQVESCSGQTGDMRRIAWSAVPGERFQTPQGETDGRWQREHVIYLSETGRQNSKTVSHEMLHDLLQTGEHPPIFEACGL